ncbi:MAG: hypothetical protein BIFFINMI_00650 [Phycisphaerae bacterium]|nr:hypothetical protein [Phycisphaerae bacterium]
MQSHYSRHRDYKKSLATAAAAWFRSRGLQVSSRYPYCLSDWERWPANVILPEVVAYVEQQRQQRAANRQTFALHKFVHHGLSSQAMLFNLVGPLIVRRDLEPLRSAFAAAGAPWPAADVSASFEVEDRELFNERQAQPTSIDLVLEGNGRQALFVEAKLVEQEFGGCSVFEDGDCSGANPARDHSQCYLHRIGRKYWERLGDLHFQEAVEDGPICPLTSYYQFFREVVFAIAKGGDFVLLYDERSPVFFRSVNGVQTGLMTFLTGFVPAEHTTRVHAVTIQAVAAAVRRSGRHDDWIGVFEEKYGLGTGNIAPAD